MMLRFMSRAFAFLVAFIFASAALAREPAPLPGADDRVSLGAYVDVLEDPTGRLRLEDLLRPEQAARFTPASSEPINFGYTRSAWWLRFSLPGGAPPRRGPHPRDRIPEHRPHRAAYPRGFV